MVNGTSVIPTTSPMSSAKASLYRGSTCVAFSDTGKGTAALGPSATGLPGRFHQIVGITGERSAITIRGFESSPYRRTVNWQEDQRNHEWGAGDC